MKILDLCAGIGGFSLAAHWLGWQTEAFCERDKFCQKVLTKNFPGVPIYDDVFTFPSKSFRGRIDVLTAGFPCQPFSAAGKRKGRDDERHIFPQIMDIVGKVQPTWCVFENVRGLLSIESGQVYAEIIASLESEGFEVITHCVPASALNAPHRRDRLWIVAHNAEYAGRKGRSRIYAAEQGSDRADDGLSEPADRDASNAESCESGTGLRETRSLKNGRQLGNDGGDTTNPVNERCERRCEQGQDGERAVHPGCGDDRAFSESQFDSQFAATDTTNTQTARHRQHGGRILPVPESTGFNNSDARNFWHEPWIDVATRTCVRGVSHGLSDGLHQSGNRDNRVNRLKALGNSIVPQIAYEIFKAIEDSERSRDTD